MECYIPYIKRPLNYPYFGNYPYLPVVTTKKQASEGPISLELMGLYLSPTESFKNSPVYVVFYTLEMSNKVNVIREEVKVRIVGNGSKICPQ